MKRKYKKSTSWHFWQSFDIIVIFLFLRSTNASKTIFLSGHRKNGNFPFPDSDICDMLYKRLAVHASNSLWERNTHIFNININMQAFSVKHSMDKKWLGQT